MSEKRCCCNCPGLPPSLKVGDVVYGYCHGTFGDSWGEKVVEHISLQRDWAVLRQRNGGYRDADTVFLYQGDPDDLVEYTTPDPDDS